jgi:hypothetical protein
MMRVICARISMSRDVKSIGSDTHQGTPVTALRDILIVPEREHELVTGLYIRTVVSNTASRVTRTRTSAIWGGPKPGLRGASEKP